jgi:hypothetical protein
MEWPTAAVLIVIAVAVALVLVVALRVLGEELARRASAKTKHREVLAEAAAELRAQVTELRSGTPVVDGEGGSGP